MGTLSQDLQHACRMLRRNPTFTLAGVMILALGIGANTAIFSVVESVLLRPPSYQDPSGLVQVWNTYPRLLPQAPNSVGDFQDFRRRSQTFFEMAAYRHSKRLEFDRRG